MNRQYQLRTLKDDVRITFEHWGDEPDIMTCPKGTALYEVRRDDVHSFCSLRMPFTVDDSEKDYPIRLPIEMLSESLAEVDPFLTTEESELLEIQWAAYDVDLPLFVPDSNKDKKIQYKKEVESIEQFRVKRLNEFCKEQKEAEVARGGHPEDAERQMEAIRARLEGLPLEHLEDMIDQYITQMAIKHQLETMKTKTVKLELKLGSIINIIALLSTHCRSHGSTTIGKLAGVYKVELVEQLPRKELRSILSKTHSVPLDVDGVDFAPLRESTQVAQA